MPNTAQRPRDADHAGWRPAAGLAVGPPTAVDSSHGGLSRSATAVKRTFDLFGAATLLLATLPIMVTAALLIRLDAPGPVFFRQTRVGRGGKHFSIIKFRTMIHGADELKASLMSLNETHGLFKIADDPRITRVGRWLRRSNLDELPQLINVLLGQMSLVGPRPLVVNEDAGILGVDRWRLQLMPGMTGLWQTQGPVRAPLADMVRLDHRYMATWTLWGDVRILLRTIRRSSCGGGVSHMPHPRWSPRLAAAPPRAAPRRVEQYAHNPRRET